MFEPRRGGDARVDSEVESESGVMNFKKSESELFEDRTTDTLE